MVFEGFPFIVGWELTLACNLRCRHCASSAGLPRDNELNLEEALALCDQFPAIAVQEVDFTGGEPLLRPDWWRIAEHVAEKNITTRIVTNGLLLTPDVIARMCDVGIDTVGISLDGLEATHDYIRGLPGMWRRVLSGIELTAKAGISVGIITAVNARNLKELPALLSILQSIGVHHWQLQPNLPQGRSEQTPELHLSEQDYIQLGSFFHDEQAKAQENGFRIVPADSLGYFTELDLAEPPWRGCPAGLYSVGITSDGKVKGCLTLPDDIIEGDLRQNDLWAIWFDDKSFSYTRQFSLDQLGPECQACDMAEQCQGGCSSMSYVTTGQFHNDPYCFHRILARRGSSLHTKGGLEETGDSATDEGVPQPDGGVGGR